jgi:hypothetical protein
MAVLLTSKFLKKAVHTGPGRLVTLFKLIALSILRHWPCFAIMVAAMVTR